MPEPEPGDQRHEPGSRGCAGVRARITTIVGVPREQVRDGARSHRRARGDRRRAGRRGVRHGLRRDQGSLGCGCQPLRVHGVRRSGRLDHRPAADDRRPRDPPPRRGGRALRARRPRGADRRRPLLGRPRRAPRPGPSGPTEGDQRRGQPQPLPPPRRRDPLHRRRGGRQGALRRSPPLGADRRQRMAGPDRARAPT